MWNSAFVCVWYVIACLITYPATSIALGSVVLFYTGVVSGLLIYPSRQSVTAETPIDCTVYDTDSLPYPQTTTAYQQV